ncbi:MAG: diphthine synthase [Methanomassiliicoccales archaeon]
MGELIFVGLGLTGEDLGARALRALREADRVFGEFYTSSLADSSIEDMEERLGRKVTLLDREEVEEGERILEAAGEGRVAFVTAGDTMAATTHVDLRIRAEERGIGTSLIHGISIFTAAASALGLQPYKFGRTVTLPFREGEYLPTSPYQRIAENRERGLHTLILLDIREEEGRFMTCQEGAEWLLAAEERVGRGLIGEDTLLCACARVGSSRERLIGGPPSRIVEEDLGPPLHCLVMPGELHFMEARSLVLFADAPSVIQD